MNAVEQDGKIGSLYSFVEFLASRVASVYLTQHDIAYNAIIVFKGKIFNTMLTRCYAGTTSYFVNVQLIRTITQKNIKRWEQDANRWLITVNGVKSADRAKDV